MTTPEPASSARPWLGAVLFLPAGGAIALAGSFVYALTTEYDVLSSDVGTAFLNFAPIAVVVSLVVTPFVWFGLRVGWPDRVRGRLLRVVTGSVASVAILMAASAALGALAHDRADSRSASACSDDERRALSELGALPTNDT